MKKRSLLISFFTIGTGLFSSWSQPAFSAVNVPECSGIPEEDSPCLIEPTTYTVSIYRVDICQSDPFPSTSTAADYEAAGCTTLFNGSGTLYEGELANENQFNLPTTGRQPIKSGTYKYLTMVLNNSFTHSGSYTSGSTTWRTNGTDNAINVTTTAGNPVEFTDQLSNWRGEDDQDNEYCDNNGGTASRCEVNYNGFELTGIGLDSSFNSTSGLGTSYLFYQAELATPISLDAGSDGYIDVTVDNSYEMYGDGTVVEAMTLAPFIFQVIYTAK